MLRQRTFLVLFVLAVAWTARNINASALNFWTAATSLPEEEEGGAAVDKTFEEGCYVCGDYRCPPDPADCLLGSVPDTCGCCSQGMCARLDGESCWNASISELSKERRIEGLCARNYICQLRTDLEPEDAPEATCVCMEQSPACGSNNRTYSTPCALHEEATRLKSASLKLKHLGPCPSRPSIYSASEDFHAHNGQLVALNCEAKGFPLPDIFWEFYAADGNTVLILPSEEWDDGVVNTREDSESSIRTSWLQIDRIAKHNTGTYHCIANNSIGEASASSIVSII